MVKYLSSLRKPSSQLVSSRAIVFIHASFGLVVQPAEMAAASFHLHDKEQIESGKTTLIPYFPGGEID